MALIATDRYRAVIGMGLTGLSVARHLAACGEAFVVMDTRAEPPLLATFQREFPDQRLLTGALDAALLRQASELVVSPGVSLDTPAITAALAAGVALGSDIDLFGQACTAPVLAITGSNGKSTVTALVGAMAEAAGLQAGVGGNLGTPALDLLAAAPLDVAVLELSSFQLERVGQLQANVAAILNVTPDHLDRYNDLPAYHRAKQRIYRGCRHAVFNRDDPLTRPLLAEGMGASSFGLSAPDLGQWGLCVQADGKTWLCQGLKPWLAVDELGIRGRHNWLNALAALAIGQAAGFPPAAMLSALRGFTGLPHRCQPIAEYRGVRFVDDSKGTNVGATVAAIEGLCADSGTRVVLIAGGQPKAQIFDALAPVLALHGRAAVLIGEAAVQLQETLAPVLPVTMAASMAEAVNAALAQAESGDVVLLSPACASFDMFADYADRGRQFAAAVQARIHGGPGHVA